jgi:hypothetical protein
MSNYEKKIKIAHCSHERTATKKIFIQKIIIMITALNVGAYQ